MLSLVKQLLVRLDIENFMRLRVIQNNEAEYVNFWSQQDMAKNKIILDVELIKLSSRKDIGCEASDKTNISSNLQFWVKIDSVLLFFFLPFFIFHNDFKLVD